MTSIQLQIILPDGSLRRETFTQGPVAFGREAENQIVFSQSLISRRHGVIHQQGEEWLLENLSDNGTWLNGKRVKRKLVVVRAGDAISVGEQEILRVEAVTPLDRAAAAAMPTTPIPSATPKPQASASSRKMKLWLSLAAMWVVVLALLVFIQPIYNSRSSTGGQWRTPELNVEQISQAVRRKPRDIAGRVQPDERTMSQHLAEARDISSRLDANADAPFRAYRAYQRAMAYTGRDTLDDSQDLRKFTEIEAQLIDGTTRRYQNAYAKMRSNNFREAELAFRELIQYFPDPQNPLIRNVEALRKEIAPLVKRRR